MTNWQDILKKPFEQDPDEMTDFMNISPRMKASKLERQILREIEKEGGALGMKNLKQFGKEAEIKQALSKLRKEGKIFMHEDGDIYTHKPKDIEKGIIDSFNLKFRGKFTQDGFTFADENALNLYKNNVQQLPELKQTLNTYRSQRAPTPQESAKVIIPSNIINDFIQRLQQTKARTNYQQATRTQQPQPTKRFSAQRGYSVPDPARLLG